MVAAWISADTGVGPSIASPSHDCSGTWADLPHAASSSSRPIAVSVPCGELVGGAEYSCVRDGSDGREHQRQRQREADVTDAVDDERLLGGGRGRRLVRPEPDQQVRRQADALPADVEAEVVVGEHQQEHRRDEQVQVGEESPALGIVGHVADGVDVDQRADAGDQQDETH